MAQPLEARVARVVADVFGVSPGEIADDSSPETIEAWDSLKHVALIVALEAEFRIVIRPEEAVDMLSVGQVKQVLIRHGVA